MTQNNDVYITTRLTSNPADVLINTSAGGGGTTYVRGISETVGPALDTVQVVTPTRAAPYSGGGSRWYCPLCQNIYLDEHDDCPVLRQLQETDDLVLVELV